MASEISIMNRLIKNARKHDDPLTPLIDEYFIKRPKSNERFWGLPADPEDRLRPPGRISPSSICGCPRAAVFKYTGGIEKKVGLDPETEAIFDDGKWRHLKLGSQFKDMEAVLGRDVFQVVSVEEDVQLDTLFIRGALDIVIKIRGVSYVVDFKGINSRGFEYIFKEDAPRAEHVLQVMTYEKMRRIKRGFLYYECKDTQQTKIYPVDWTPEAWVQIQEWCEEVIEAMDKEQLPPTHPECKAGRYHFYKCPYAHACFGGKQNAEIERITFRTFKGVPETWEENR